MAMHHLELSEHDSEFVRQCVLDGRYKDANEVVEAGLRLLVERQEEECQKLEHLRAEVQKGMDDLEAGRYIDVNGPEVLDAFFNDIDREAEAIMKRGRNDENVAGTFPFEVKSMALNFSVHRVGE